MVKGEVEVRTTHRSSGFRVALGFGLVVAKRKKRNKIFNTERRIAWIFSHHY